MPYPTSSTFLGCWRVWTTCLMIAVVLCFVPAALADDAPGTAETIIEDYEAGHWLYENPAQGVRVEIFRMQDEAEKILWYEADLQFTQEEPLRFYAANPEAPGKGFAYPERLVRDNRAVFGVNDDQFGHRVYNHKTVGVVIRDGAILGDKTHKSGNKGWPSLDTAAFFADGSMRVFQSAEHTAQEYLDMGAENVLCFGPYLIKDGEINPLLQKNYRTREPRSAIGMIAPYHYVVLSVEGRIKQSQGVPVEWLATRMKELNVTEALNLDGGKTCCLVFMGKKLETTNPNGLVRKGRSVSGMLGLGVSDKVPAFVGLDE